VQHFPDPQAENKQDDGNKYQSILDWFAAGNELELTDWMSREEYWKALKKVKGLADFAKKNGPGGREAERYAMMDLVIDALHQHSMLGKVDVKNVRSYTDMVGSMLGSVDDFDHFEE
jgi:magnesium chelatase subunit I